MDCAGFGRRWLIDEALVAKSKQDIIALLNQIVTRVSRVAEASGFETEPVFVDDIRDYFKAGRVEIQVGRNNMFEGPQTIDITIYDDDDIAVTIPTAVSEKFNIPTNNSFRSVESVIDFIKKFSQHLRSQGMKPAAKLGAL